ncbi:hypothetical protein TURU_163326 [Turdus rufiventris]|nr:hypothetical protein TURU_163326 [Turdus rufiventris]
MSLFQSSSPDSSTQQLVGLGASLSGSNNRSSSALPLPSSCHLYLHFPSWLNPTFANFVVSELLNNIQTRKEVPDTQLSLLLPSVLLQVQTPNQETDQSYVDVEEFLVPKTETKLLQGEHCNHWISEVSSLLAFPAEAMLMFSGEFGSAEVVMKSNPLHQCSDYTTNDNMKSNMTPYLQDLTLTDGAVFKQCHVASSNKAKDTKVKS